MSGILAGLPPLGQPQAPPWAPQPARSFDWEAELEQLRPAHAEEWTASAVAPELTRANVVSLSGREAYQALVGPFLQQKKDNSQSGGQFIGAETARALQHYRDIEEGPGGWWCSGLDPLNDWKAHQDHGQLKADLPRVSAEGKTLKYEAPKGLGHRLLFLRVPASVALTIGREHGLIPPQAVLMDSDGSRGAFWRWWNEETRLPWVLGEGSKKDGACLTAGVACSSVNGIWSAAPKDENGVPRLLPDFDAVKLEGRRIYVLFDHDTNRKKRSDFLAAATRLGELLAERGAEVTVGLVPRPRKNEPALKGIDDWLADGKSLKAALKGQRKLKSKPVLPVLRRPDVVAPSDCFLSQHPPARIPEAIDQRLVGLASGMGAGKTWAIEEAVRPYLEVGVPVVVIGHRRQLVEDLGEKLGVATGDEAKPGNPLRHQGIALCIDSLCPFSALRFNARDWRGSVVVLDEVTAVLAHALLGRGTAVASRLGSVLQELQELLRHAAQVIVADAHVDDDTLKLLEQLMGLPEQGGRAWLIGSTRKPAQGRKLHVCQSQEQWLAALTNKLKQRGRVWVSTTAQKDDQALSAANLGRLAAEHWPEARVLVVDSTTVAIAGHDAERLGREPNEVAGAYDVVVASPAITAGLSVDKLPSHFDAVMVRTGGIISPRDVAQAAERVRDDCDRWLWADETAPGAQLREGCGAHDWQDLLANRSKEAERVIGALQQAGAVLPCGNFSLWEAHWAKLAARSNQEADAYRATIVGLLEQQGYAVVHCRAMEEEEAALASAVSKGLKQQAEQAVEAAASALLQAREISEEEAKKLEERRAPLTADDHAALKRHQHKNKWGQCTEASLEADRLDLYAVLRRRWWLMQTPDAVMARDRRKAEELAGGGPLFKPRVTERTIQQKVELLRELGLDVLMATRGHVDSASPLFKGVVAKAAELADRVEAAFGAAVLSGQREATTVKRLLALVGYNLRVVGRPRNGAERSYAYVVEEVVLPDGLSFEDLADAWALRERGEAAKSLIAPSNGPWVVRKLPFIREGTLQTSGFRTSRSWMDDPEQMREVLGLEFYAPPERNNPEMEEELAWLA